jgi:hypothetical protein
MTDYATHLAIVRAADAAWKAWHDAGYPASGALADAALAAVERLAKSHTERMAALERRKQAIREECSRPMPYSC